MLSKNDKQNISDYLAKRKDIQVAYLFGSQASGKADNLSDIDIAILFNAGLTVVQRFEQKLKIMGDVGSLLGRDDVEVVDLNSAPVALRFSAIENREILFVNDDNDRVDFESRVMTMYQDYKYFMNINSQNSLESIARMEV